MRVWLFDIDGTLIASGGAGQAATFSALQAVFGVPLRPDAIQFAGRTDRAIAAEVFQLHDIPNTPENWETFRHVYLQQLGHHLESQEGRVLHGVTELIEVLTANESHHLGLLTGNIRDGAERKLRHYQLWHRFHFGGFGDDHESRDDVARQALESAVDHLAQPVAPDQVWVIGDTVNDIRCARAIGAHVIAVSTGGTGADELLAAGPDLLLDDLQLSADLQALID